MGSEASQASSYSFHHELTKLRVDMPQIEIPRGSWFQQQQQQPLSQAGEVTQLVKTLAKPG